MPSAGRAGKACETAGTDAAQSCLGSWMDEEEGSIFLEFIIRKHGLDGRALSEFVAARGGKLASREEQALAKLAGLLDGRFTYVPSTAAIETMVRLVIDGVRPEAFLSSPALNTDELRAETSNVPDRRRSWVYAGPTPARVGPEGELPLEEFRAAMARPLSLAAPLSPAIKVFSRTAEILGRGDATGVVNRGVFVTYIRGYDYPVIAKFVEPDKKKFDYEALSLWAADATGVGPRFFGRLEDVPGFEGLSALVFAPAAGRFDYLGTEHRLFYHLTGQKLKTALLDRLEALGKWVNPSTQILVSDLGAAVIDPRDTGLFMREYRQFEALRLIEQSA